jgi:REP element-mobilizing transposase RayT
MAHTYTSLRIHCLFSTKGRTKTISREWRADLWAYMGGIARANGMKAIAIGGTADHVHLLLSIPPTMAVAKALQLIKAGSSKWVHEKTRNKLFVWQEAYAAFTIGVSQVEATVRYIRNQEAHHTKKGFEEELVQFLKRHGIDYDPRYVFG